MLYLSVEFLSFSFYAEKIPFVCGCRNLGEALRRIIEGATMLRTKGEAGTGNIVEAVRHARAVQKSIKMLSNMDKNELFAAAKVLFFSFLSFPFPFLSFIFRN
jgi:pyridoxal biosynthesis lyase PdxS